MTSLRLKLLRKLRTLGYQVALREDTRFFDIYQDDGPRAQITHRLSYPEAQQLARQPTHPVKLSDFTYQTGAVTLYLFPEPETTKQGVLL